MVQARPAMLPYRADAIFAWVALALLMLPVFGPLVVRDLAGWTPTHGHTGIAASVPHWHPWDGSDDSSQTRGHGFTFGDQDIAAGVVTVAPGELVQLPAPVAAFEWAAAASDGLAPAASNAAPPSPPPRP